MVVILLALAALLLYFYPERVNPPAFAFELPSPFSSAHSFFLSVSALVVGYFFGRGFLRDGSLQLLVLGGGSLVLGLGFLLSQVLGNPPFGGPNQLVGISGLSFLLSGIFYGSFAAMTLSNRPQVLFRRRAALAVEYSIGIGLILAVVWIFQTGMAPAFFQPGVGPTLLRQQALGASTILFAAASLVLMRMYSRSKDGILYWFSLGLAAVSIGFLSAFLGKVPGGPFSWLGRISVALGGLYLLYAIVEAYGSGKAGQAQRTIPSADVQGT